MTDDQQTKGTEGHEPVEGLNQEQQRLRDSADAETRRLAENEEAERLRHVDHDAAEQRRTDEHERHRAG